MNNNIEYQAIVMNTNIFDNNSMNNYQYDSSDEIDIEITDYKHGKEVVHTYSVPYHTTFCNKKRLMCFSTTNNTKCSYKFNCIYAHSYNDQIIDDDRLFIYKI